MSFCNYLLSFGFAVEEYTTIQEHKETQDKYLDQISDALDVIKEGAKVWDGGNIYAVLQLRAETMRLLLSIPVVAVPYQFDTKFCGRLTG